MTDETPASSTRQPWRSYAQTQDYLFSLKAAGLKFGIDRMRRLSSLLGHPERGLPVVHVGGTNGKGSVSAMLEAILRESGWRTGLYTSPHLVRLGERVQVNREILTESEIMDFVAQLDPIAAEIGRGDISEHPSFFEFMTAMALLQFRNRQCDVAVVEVGLGGRLDATNIVEPEVTVITSIGLDHCEILGDTLAKIAAEKAGILKPGIPVVLGRLPSEARQVIEQRARELRCPLTAVDDVFGLDLAGCPETSLAGEYQRINAATACLAARALGKRWKITEETICRGLMNTQWAGRWQRMTSAGRQLILDASHNPEGAAVLEANLAALVREQNGRKPRVIAGVLGAARAEPLLAVIARHASELYLVEPRQSRACSREELRDLVPEFFRPNIRFSTVEELFPRGQCVLGAENETIVVTGSIYLIGEVLTLIQQDTSGEGRRLQDF